MASKGQLTRREGFRWPSREDREFAEEDLYRPLKLMYSAHQVGIDETLAAARLMGTAPRRARAVGLVPYSLETGYGLSPQAEDRLDELLERARAVLAEWGVEGA